MPIEYRIDSRRGLVVATALGTLTDEDVFGYQREVWSRPDVAGYDELVDMSQVERIVLPSADRVRELAAFSAGMDDPSPGSRFAIFAPTDLAFGLGRMYETYRGLAGGGTKQVGVFRTLAEALVFLEIDELPDRRPPGAAA
jgi:hypothetical protein